MHRTLIQSLKEWRTAPDRQPLLLRGARQTGKTYLVEHFGLEHFDHLIKINFELERHFAECFRTLDAKQIIQELQLLTNQSITPGKSLLFFDEIQECPAAIQSLRYFYEQVPELHVIGAGSLLEFALAADDFSMPVGRVEYRYLYPLTFNEMLLALGEHKLLDFLSNIEWNNIIPISIHRELLKKLKLYAMLGGMPRVIDLYVKNEDLLLCRKIQTALLSSYRDDFGKYASRVQQRYCERVFDKSIEFITKNFKYTDIDPDMDYRQLKTAMQLLSKANILTPIYLTSASGIPLSATQMSKKFKLLFLDLGLVQAAGRLSPELLLKTDLTQINQGALTEQFVGQHLLTIQPNYDNANLFYWKRDDKTRSAEIDYVYSFEDLIIPLEVKSGKTGRLKSMHIFMETKHAPLGIKLSTDAMDTTSDIWSIPLYLIEQLPKLLLQYRRNA